MTPARFQKTLKQKRGMERKTQGNIPQTEMQEISQDVDLDLGRLP